MLMSFNYQVLKKDNFKVQNSFVFGFVMFLITRSIKFFAELIMKQNLSLINKHQF